MKLFNYGRELILRYVAFVLSCLIEQLVSVFILWTACVIVRIHVEVNLSGDIFSFFEPVYQTDALLVLLLQLGKVLKLPSKHTPHHILFQIVYVAILELVHHLFHLSVCNEPDHWVLVFHQPHWVIVVIVGVR